MEGGRTVVVQEEKHQRSLAIRTEDTAWTCEQIVC